MKNSVKISDIVVSFTIEAPNENIIDAEIEFVKSFLAELLPVVMIKEAKLEEEIK